MARIDRAVHQKERREVLVNADFVTPQVIGVRPFFIAVDPPWENGYDIWI